MKRYKAVIPSDYHNHVSSRVDSSLSNVKAASDPMTYRKLWWKQDLSKEPAIVYVDVSPTGSIQSMRCRMSEDPCSLLAQLYQCTGLEIMQRKQLASAPCPSRLIRRIRGGNSIFLGLISHRAGQRLTNISNCRRRTRRLGHCGGESVGQFISYSDKAGNSLLNWRFRNIRGCNFEARQYLLAHLCLC